MIINPIIPLAPMIIIAILLLIPRRKGLLNYILQVAAVLLLIIIDIRPMKITESAEVVELDANVLLVVDNTISMLAEDTQREGHDTRLDDIKEDCAYIVEELNGASFSVIKFDNEARRMVPFSKDPLLALQCINSLYGQTEYYASGTNFGVAHDTMEQVLKDNESSCMAVFIFTDGEITNTDYNDGNLTSFKDLKGYVDTGAVLGYGTEDGGMMKVKDNLYQEEDAQAHYLKTYDENYDLVNAVSKLDEKNLKKLSGDLNIEYINVREKSDLKRIVEKTKSDFQKAGMDPVKKQTVGYEDIYYWFLIPLLMIMIADFILAGANPKPR